MKRRTITAVTLEEVIEMIKERLIKAGSQEALAKEFGVSQQYIGDLLRRKRTPGETVLNALGLQKVIYYERREEES
jgi:transcriptional regulator with XRE-family HTH domain